jgi:hypothetical protein
MARYTEAYSSFVRRLDEVEILRRLAAKKERSDPVGLRNEINAISRSAVVLLSSHLEGYIKELGELALNSLLTNGIDRSRMPNGFFYHISKEEIRKIKESNDADTMGEKIFDFLQSEHVHLSKSGPFTMIIEVEKFNKGFSNPAFKKISAYIGRFGFDRYSSDLGRKLGRDYSACKTKVEYLVATRNKIAHGDPNATETPSDIKKMMELIRQFACATDDCFANWWKVNYCKLRT